MSHRIHLRIKQGDYTKTIYTWIKDSEYEKAIVFLSEKLILYPNSRAALSLLGYCYYMKQDFLNSSNCYEQLSAIYPDVPEYRMHLAMSLYQACKYEEALKVTYLMEDENVRTGTEINSTNEILKIQSAVKFAEDDLKVARTLVDQMTEKSKSSETQYESGDSAAGEKEINQGCLLLKEERLTDALIKFTNGAKILGPKPDLLYNQALVHYRMNEYGKSLKLIGEIIEKGIREHPELSVGSTTDGIEVRSVGNTLTLHESALVEAFNLKAAIEYDRKNYDLAKEALTDLPPRSEEELDSVTLHNHALLFMDEEPSEGFEKLQFLVQQVSFPAETFANLLLLYCKYEYFDLAADVMAENASFTFKYLTPYLYEYLDGVITMQTNPEDAYKKFDEMANKYTDTMKKITKSITDLKGTVQGSNTAGTSESASSAQLVKLQSEYKSTLELYLPVLMSQAKIYWDLELYQQVEKVFRKSVEFCADADVWKLNVAHVLFMQENKYKEATGFYEPLVKQSYDNLVEVSAIVLANLCVSYIMTGMNEEAEELMRKIEKEEEQLAYSDPERKTYHLCIVNLVIGTLYCVKGNYEFGISRVIKSLEPYNKKLGTDTWFYAKRCFMSLLESMSKQTILIKGSIISDCHAFLTACERHGIDVKAIIEPPLELETLHPGKNTVTYEARLLRALLIKVTDFT